MLNAEQVFQAIQSLPVPERLRVVERVVHALADASTGEAEPRAAEAGRSLLGLFAGEPELVDEVAAMAFAARSRDRLRNRNEDDESDP